MDESRLKASIWTTWRHGHWELEPRWQSWETTLESGDWTEFAPNLSVWLAAEIVTPHEEIEAERETCCECPKRSWVPEEWDEAAP